MNTPRKTMVVSLLASAALSLSVGLFAAEPESENSVQESAVQPPTSMESAIERRREMLEKRRERYRDARSGRFWRQPPGWLRPKSGSINAKRPWMNSSAAVATPQRREGALGNGGKTPGPRGTENAQRPAAMRWNSSA